MTPPMLKKILTRCAVLMLLGAPAAHAADSATVTPVIPLPAQVVPKQGTFRLGPGTTIVVRGGDEAATLELFTKGGVRVIPGSYLARRQPDGSNPGAGYIRVALVQDSTTTAEALHRIVDVLAGPSSREAR